MQEKKGDTSVRISEIRRSAFTGMDEKPLTKAGQIRAIWPQIEAAVKNGQRPEQIRQWLAQAGVDVCASTLRVCMTRIRREERKLQLRNAEQLALGLVDKEASSGRSWPTVATAAPEVNGRPEEPFDPLGPAKRALSRKQFDIREVHGDGDPRNKNLI